MKPVIAAAFACIITTASFAGEAPNCAALRTDFRAALADFTQAEQRVSQLKRSPSMPPQEIRRRATDDAILRSSRVADLASVMQRGQCLGYNGRPGDWATVLRTTNDAIAGFGRYGAMPDGVAVAAQPAPQAAPAPQPEGDSNWAFLPSALSTQPAPAPAPAPAPVPQGTMASADPQSAAPRGGACVKLSEERVGAGLDQYLENNCDYAVHVKLCLAWAEPKKTSQFQCGTKTVFSTGKRPIEPGFRRKVATTTEPFRWLLNRCNASEDPACVPRTPGQ